jgi:hypothetical protein
VLEDEDGCILHEGSGDGDALLLHTRELHAPLADLGVVPLAKRSMKSWALAARAAATTWSGAKDDWP